MTIEYEDYCSLNLEYIKRSFKLDFINCFDCRDLYPYSEYCYQEVRTPINKGWLSFTPSLERVVKFYHLKFDWGHSMRVFSVILPTPLLFIGACAKIDDVSLKKLLIDKIKESFPHSEENDSHTKNN